MSPLRIVVASALPVIREGLSAAITREPDMLVVAAVSSMRDISIQCPQHRPDACVIDLLLGEDDLQTIRDIHRACAPAALVVLTSDFAMGEAAESALGGKIVFVSKTASMADTLQALREAAGRAPKPYNP
jgi:DNA-binding NarL/FixJ family response regulator